MKLIALTPGEPAGIGPDLLVQIAQHRLPANLVVIADPDLLLARAKQLGLSIKIQIFENNVSILPFEKEEERGVSVLPIKLKKPCIPGRLDSANAEYVLETLTIAAQGCLSGKFSAIVTGPVHKGIINEAGITFSGHTEFFAEQAKVDQVVMLLATNNLRVALATTHLPLRQVADAITEECLMNILRVLHKDLKKYFQINNPKILVCGLNPHAGENGHLGREEIEIIAPTLEKLRQEGMQLMGPMPADTAFLPHHLAEVDALLAMYHDQGLPVLKHMGFDKAVNITLGLPFLRTSVDHGTALELVGTGHANFGSFLAAIEMAVKFAN